MVGTDNPHAVLKEILNLLKKESIASITEIERAIGVGRNWLSGFLAALYALDLLHCKGTRTHKLFMIRDYEKIKEYLGEY
jgi:2-polyprenyl-3-methyl-5-hydroxy-6-metoxy-1,4-benzoquinol methylase